MSNSKIVEKKSLSNKSLFFYIFGAILMIVIIIWGVIIFIDSKDINNSEPAPQETPIVLEKIVKTVSGKSVEEDRKEILNNLSDLLLQASHNPDNKSLEELLLELDRENFSFLENSEITGIKLTDENNKYEKISAYQALLVFSSLILAEDPTTSFEPTNTMFLDNVVIDQEVGIAFVPLSIYTKSSNIFTLQFVYHNNEWKFYPATVLETIYISDYFANNNNQVGPQIDP